MSDPSDVNSKESKYDTNIKNVSQTPRLSVKSNGSEVVDKDKKYSYEEVLTIIGFGKTQCLMLLTCGLLLMMVICETMGMSIITIASQCDFATTSVEKAIMSGAAFIGECYCSFWV